jgi:hypothetical protein
MNRGRSSITPVFFAVVDMDIDGMRPGGYLGDSSFVLSTVDSNTE